MRSIEIHENETFCRRAYFPNYADVLVKEGDEVRFGDTIARSVLFDKIISIPWDGRNPDEKRSIAIAVGDKVKKGDVLVEKNGFFAKNILSAGNGRVIAISSTKIYIEENDKYLTELSPFVGKISKVERDHVEFEIFGDSIQGVWGNEKNAVGMLALANNNELPGSNSLLTVEGQLTEDDLSDLFSGESAGYILAGVNASLAPQLIRSNRSVVVLSGFGKHEMSIPARRILARNENKLAIINGRINDPLRGIFSEVIFPKTQFDPVETKTINKANAVMVYTMLGKDRVAAVTKSSQGRVRLSSGIYDHALEVVYSTGEREIVPRSQVKKIK